MGHLGTRVSFSNSGYEPNLDPHLDRIREHRRTRQALLQLYPDTLATLGAYYDARQWPPQVAKALADLSGVARLILGASTPVDGPTADLPPSQRCPGAELAQLALDAAKGDKKAKSELASLRTLAKQAKDDALASFAASYAFLLAQEKEAKAKRLTIIRSTL